MSVDLTMEGIGFDRPALDTQLRRYARSYRRRLRKMAKSNDNLGDLIYTFPAVAFVIAANHGNPLLRSEATALVKKGAPLRKIANCLGLPSWLRRLPPEAFTGDFGRLPDSERFNRQVVNFIPADADASRVWFAWIGKAYRLCHEDFALWIAQQKLWRANLGHGDILLPLAAFAWFSHAPHTKGRGLIEKPWQKNMRFGKAVEAANSWFVRLLLEDYRDSNGRNGRWFVEQRASGYRIVPLRTARDLEDEGQRMNHCVACYASELATGESLIYSVRRGNKHVATLEVKQDYTMDGTAVIAQLLGPHNEEVDISILHAVQSWLRRQGNYPYIQAGKYTLAGFDSTRWDALWAPYWEAHGDSRTVASRAVQLQPIQLHHALRGLAMLI